MPDDFRLRLELVDYCKRLYDRGLVGGTQGNFSVRLDLGRVLITPAGSNLGYLKPADLVVISMNGRKISGQGEPSSEYLLHLGIYDHRGNIQAICHAHPIALTVCAIADIDLNEPILPEIVNQFGYIPRVEYSTPGSRELVEKLAMVIDKHSAFILQNHGAATLGENLDDAFNRMEMLERYAEAIILAKGLGPIRLLPSISPLTMPGHKKIEK